MAKPKNVDATFASVRKIVNSVGAENKVIDFVDKLLSAGLILSPVVLGPAALPLLALFDMKTEMIRSVSDLARRIAGSGDDFLTRSQLLASAHCLITYTAFFDAARDSLGGMWREFSLTSEEADLILSRSSESNSLSMFGPSDGVLTGAVNYASLPPVSLPHPASSYRTEADERRKMYASMAKNFNRIVVELDSHAAFSTTRKAELQKAFEELPDLAVQYYFSQYLDLMLDFKDFFGWATLYEHQKTQEMVIDATDNLKVQALAAHRALLGIDLGLQNLAEGIRAISISSALGDCHLRQVAKDLAIVHQEAVSLRVIKDLYAEPGGGPALTYPTKADAFVPQSYKALQYSDVRLNLEDEVSWSRVDQSDDLGSFMVRYFSSPYSTQSPLVILGHPGSGKSLLTELIAARLLPPVFNAVRIELRDIDPDTDIQSQIETQIRVDTGRDVNWSDYSAGLLDSPPLIILDGYDELLQSTGKVFASYLETVQRFQTREALMKRPTRIVVTSRITLIDKASIPIGSTIVRLMEFDESRRERWISVWNKTNASYFESSGVKPFAIPEGSRLVELAQQPLLLLMLAIYDSRKNELANSDLDQTMLYYSLLCRFIERERSKGETGHRFKAMRPDEQKKLVEADLSRLGIAAVGMFNRRTVHTHRSELDADIEYYAETRELPATSGALLSQADLLLGSFFFIHESKSKSGDPDDAASGSPAAFEFLHNTFGEFLAADFILRRLLNEARIVSAFNANEVLRAKLDEQLSRPHGYWFSCLSFTAFHSRPVVFEMMREWLPHRLAADGLSQTEMTNCVKLIVDRQLHDLVNVSPSSWFASEIHETPFGQFSHLGHLAVYSLNLVLLGAVVSGSGYEFRVKSTDPDSARDQGSWMSLVNLWRSWFSFDGLLGVTAIVACARQGGGVIIAARERLGTPPSRSKLEAMANLSHSLADEASHTLASLAVADVHGQAAHQIAGLRARDSTLGADLTAVIAAKAGKVADSPIGPWLALGRRTGNGPLPASLLAAYEVIFFEDNSEALIAAVGSVGPDSIGWLSTLSRYEAHVVVSAKSTYEPRWLNNVALYLKEGEFDCGSHFIAPVLRQLRAQHVEPAMRSVVDVLLSNDDGRLSCEARVELLLLCHSYGLQDRLGKADRLLAEVLDSWDCLNDVPQDSLVELVCLIMERSAQAPCRRRIRAAADAAIRSRLEAEGVSFALCLATYALTSVGAKLLNDVSRKMITRSPASIQLYYRPKFLLALLRAAHVRKDASFASNVILSELRYSQRGSEGLNVYLPRWLRRALKTFNEKDADRLLTGQQRRDVEWFLKSVHAPFMPWSSKADADAGQLELPLQQGPRVARID
ncbi:ATP-binding protein [Micromonospora noduli]|uniref:NACHT domain-containing protein n=1 Tax=Micromonospora noduli TaxID=709876 RepID=UPI0034149E45